MQFINSCRVCIPERHDNVAGKQTRIRRWALPVNLIDQDSCANRQLVFVGEATRYGNILSRNANPTAAHAAVLQQLRSYEFDRIDPDSEAESLRGHNGRGIDANHLT